MTTQTFRLSSLPPSTNNLFANAAKGRVKSAAYRAWIKEAGLELMIQRPKPIDGKLAVEIVCRRNNRRDVSNAIKPVEDLLVTHGVMGDDRQVNTITARWSDEITGVVVHVREWEGT